jgi:tRNA G18 (ribose-2'-O)-methylase SpoU
MKLITSRQNLIFKQWHECLNSKGIQRHGQALISGEKIVRGLLLTHAQRVLALIYPEKHKPTKKLNLSEGMCFELKANLFKELDIFGTNFPLALVSVPAFENLEKSKVDKIKGCIPVLQFQDPRNVGAVLRTTVGMGVKDVVLAAGCAHPFHPGSIRASSGAVFSVNFLNLKSKLDFEIPVIGLDAKGISAHKFKFPDSFFLVPGVEGPGLNSKFDYHSSISIPMESEIESYNASVATALALYEWKRQFFHK